MDMERLNSLIIDNGVMPLLQEFHIEPSPQLKEVPFGIHRLRKLRYLAFFDMPKEFERHMDPNMDCNIGLLHIYKMSALVTSSDQDGGVYETHALRDSNFSFW
ncbi:hypothetical protein FF1_001835 [Malus domestica]